MRDSRDDKIKEERCLQEILDVTRFCFKKKKMLQDFLLLVLI